MPSITTPAIPRRKASVPNNSPETASSDLPAETTRTSPSPPISSAAITDIRSPLAAAVTARPANRTPGTNGRMRGGQHVQRLVRVGETRGVDVAQPFEKVGVGE